MGCLRPNKMLHQLEMPTGLRRFVQVMRQFVNAHRRDAIWSGRVGHFHEAVVGDERPRGGVRFCLGARNDMDVDVTRGRLSFDESRHVAGETSDSVAAQLYLSL